MSNIEATPVMGAVTPSPDRTMVVPAGGIPTADGGRRRPDADADGRHDKLPRLQIGHAADGAVLRRLRISADLRAAGRDGPAPGGSPARRTDRSDRRPAFPPECRRQHGRDGRARTSWLPMQPSRATMPASRGEAAASSSKISAAATARKSGICASAPTSRRPRPREPC